MENETAVEIASIIQKMFPEEEGYIHGHGYMGGLLEGRYKDYSHCVAVGKRLDDAIIDSIIKGPNAAYHRLYEEVNRELGERTAALSEALNSRGIRSLAVVPTMSDSEIEARHMETLSSDFSHKMAATRAGLGWIGKTDLFISERFGPRLRLATVLADSPLAASATPVNESRCGDCRVCVEACPAGAANGRSWNVHSSRDDFYDAFKCRETCRDLTKKRLGINASLCGICVSVCPVGKGLRRDEGAPRRDKGERHG
ncbi:MAG: epoxyqueuosine reductase [Spirochaetes bacterium]|nr:epoxyqueuosine reductase [Spirochaetota bacterium]